MVCYAGEGGLYYCKDDRSGRPVRLIEWFSTKLSAHLGIPVADCAVIEDEDGNTYFGSLSHASTADSFACADYLSTPAKDELGSPAPWLGRHLEGLFALDLFLDNPDRDLRNFVLQRDGSRLVLRAIDFAASSLDQIKGCEFPIASTRTILVGRQMRRLHGRFDGSAIEMVDRIGAVPVGVIEGILQRIPSDWASETQKERICEAWSNAGRDERLATLRMGLKDGKFL